MRTLLGLSLFLMILGYSNGSNSQPRFSEQADLATPASYPSGSTGSYISVNPADFLGECPDEIEGQINHIQRAIALVKQHSPIGNVWANAELNIAIDLAQVTYSNPACQQDPEIPRLGAAIQAGQATLSFGESQVNNSLEMQQNLLENLRF